MAKKKRRKVPPAPATVADSGACFNCEKEVSADGYCYGCQHFVCDDCDKNHGLLGPHATDDHLQEGAW